MEIVINGGRVACRVMELSPRKFKAQFIPVQPIKHVIEMKFNGEHILNSPFILPLYKSLDVSRENNSDMQLLPAKNMKDVSNE